MRKLRASQKLALAVSLCSCSAPQNEIAARPPIVDIHGSSGAVIETPGVESAHKKRPPPKKCANVNYVLSQMFWDVIDQIPNDDTVRIDIPTTTSPLLQGLRIREGQVLLLAYARTTLVEGKATITVGEVSSAGVEFRYELKNWTDTEALKKTGASQGDIARFINLHDRSNDGVFSVGYNKGYRDPYAVLVESLQPGWMSVAPGPTIDTAILKFDHVIRCD